MNKFVIITNATSDLPQSIVDQYHLDYFPMEVNFGEEVLKQYLDERGFKLKDFYARLDNKEVAKTSLIPMQAFIDKFTPYLEKGIDVFYLGLSSGLSATWVQANLAREELLAHFKNRKIVLVDSLSASLAEGVLVIEALKKQKEGATIEEVASHIEKLRHQVVAFLAPQDLETLKRGGRISAAKAFFGNLMGVVPIITIDDEGKLVPVSKARGFKKVAMEMIELSKDLVKKPYKGSIHIVHSNALESAQLLGKMFTEAYEGGEVIISNLGPVISAHTGTGSVCIIFVGEHRLKIK